MFLLVGLSETLQCSIKKHYNMCEPVEIFRSNLLKMSFCLNMSMGISAYFMQYSILNRAEVAKIAFCEPEVGEDVRVNYSRSNRSRVIRPTHFVSNNGLRGP